MAHIPPADVRSVFDVQIDIARERIADLQRDARRHQSRPGRSFTAAARHGLGSRLIRLGAALAPDEPLRRSGSATRPS